MKLQQKLLAASVALLLATAAQQADASYSCDGSNDRLVGTSTTQYNMPITIGIWFKITAHPLAQDAPIMLSATAGSNANSVWLGIHTTDDTWRVRSNAGGPTAETTGNVDGVWTPWVGTFGSSTERDIFFSTVANTVENTTSDTPVNFDNIYLCEDATGGQDYAGKLAAVTVWDVDISDTPANLSAFMTAATVPTFSAGPTLGTPTVSTLPTTFTSLYSGNVFGTACPNGTAGNATQTEAGQCSGGGAAPSSFNEAVTAAVGDGATFTGLAAGTVYDLSFVIRRSNIISSIDSSNMVLHYPLTASNSTQANDGLDATGDLTVTSAVFDSDHPNFTPASTLASIADASTTSSVFSVNPTVVSETTSAYTLDGTTSGSTEVDTVICKKDSTAPNQAEADAGTCAGGSGQLGHTSETWNGADSMSVTASGSPPLPIHDLYSTDGTSVVANLDKFLDPPSGKQFMTLASVHANSPCFGQSPAVVAGDILVIDTLSDPGGYAVTPFDTCLFSVASGGDPSRQLIDFDVYDVSLAAYYGAAVAVVNNLAPTLVDTWPYTDELFQRNTNPGISLSSIITDPEADDVDWSVSSGALPTNWALDAETGAITGGVPGACGIYTFTIRATDIYAATLDNPSQITIGPLVPDVIDVAEATATATIEAICSLVATTGTPTAHASIPIGDVVTTEPPAGSLVIPSQEVILHLSSGPSGASGGGGDGNMRLRRPRGMRTY